MPEDDYDYEHEDEFRKALRHLLTVPHFREYACPSCGSSMRVHALQVYATCPNCDQVCKLRHTGPNDTDDVLDRVDAALAWADTPEAWEAVARRRQYLLNYFAQHGDPLSPDD